MIMYAVFINIDFKKSFSNISITYQSELVISSMTCKQSVKYNFSSMILTSVAQSSHAKM